MAGEDRRRCLESRPDGRRIAVVTPEAPKAEHEVVSLENFHDELPGRVK